MLIVISTKKNENAISPESKPVRGEPFGKLRTGLSNHERPFDRLRANGKRCIFGATARREGSMKRLERGERGFTMVELIVVLLILGVLAGVVTVGIVGLMGRGKAEGYTVDERTIQFAVSIFYADKHAYSGTDGGWNEAGSYTSANNYPTASGRASAVYHGNETLLNGHKVYMLMDGADGDPADAAEIRAAAIWMSLLVNNPGDGDASGAGPDTARGDANSPLAREYGPYLHNVPSSCSIDNSSRGSGTYTWIVGAYGRVYGAFEHYSLWYAGFSGRYP